MPITKKQLEKIIQESYKAFDRPSQATAAVRSALAMTPGRGGLSNPDLQWIARKAKVSPHMIQSIYLERRVPSQEVSMRILKVLGRG